MYRNASGARRTSHVVTGSGASAPRPNSAISSPEHLLDALGPGLEQVERAIGHARDGARAISPASRTSVLPISMKRPPRGSSSSDASTNSRAKRVEHDVHALARR